MKRYYSNIKLYKKILNYNCYNLIDVYYTDVYDKMLTAVFI